MLTTLKRITKQITERRSSQWPKVRKAWLKEHPTCAACGTRKNVEAHHKVPFHVDPGKELDPQNLTTLCDAGMKCHFTFGHLGNWKSYNESVDEDSQAFLKKVQERP